MLTKCPNCSTTFRVTPTQLKARAGKVRCGQCSLVFNAIDTLDDDTTGVVHEPTQTIAAEAEHAVETEHIATTVEAPLLPEETEVGTDVIDIGEAEFVVAEAADIEFSENVAELQTETDAGASDNEPIEPVTENENTDLTDYLADPLLHESETSSRRWPWVAAAAVAIVALLVQAIYLYRVEIAVLQPDLRPLLQAACKPLHCDVPRPRSIETLSIEASDLRPDPLQTGRLTLTATLRSKAVYAQEWPLLELTVTDVADNKLAVKDFAASEYLPKDKNDKGNKNINASLAAGFPANGEIAVTLPLDVGDLPAAGYRLYIFYP